MKADELLSFRQAYRELGDASESSIDDETIAALITDRLEGAERDALMQRLLDSPDAMQRYREMLAIHQAARPSRRTPTAAFVALAATLLVGALAAGWFLGRSPATATATTLRSEGRPTITSAMTELPRSAFVLRWQLEGTATEGVLYDVRVSNDAGALITVETLSASELDISSLLGDLASGSAIYFKVDARLPDGEGVGSETFVVTIR